MQLTGEQLAALKAELTNDPTGVGYAQPIADGAWGLVEQMLNAAASPAVIVWKTRVTQDEIMRNGFDWTRVDNLSVGPARVWEWMFSNAERSIDPSKSNVRAGIEAVWKGVAADLAVRAAVYVHCKRSATVLERLFAVGTGSDASPATMGVEGFIPAEEILRAWRS